MKSSVKNRIEVVNSNLNSIETANECKVSEGTIRAHEQFQWLKFAAGRTIYLNAEQLVPLFELLPECGMSVTTDVVL
jgi:hypothetical protein